MRVVSLMLLVASGASALAAVDETVEVGPRKLLFLDDSFIASAENVTRTVHEARKFEGNPVLRPAEPWEGKTALLYGSVLREDGRYRMWYHNSQGVGYAESADGIEWTKPMLGLFESEGHDTNTVVHRDAEEGQPNRLPYFYEVFGVHKGKDGRYVMGFLNIQRDYDGPRPSAFHGRQRRGLGVAASHDGITWTLVDNWATEATCDGGTYWMFDPARDAYVLYGRTKFIADGLLEAWGDDPWVSRHFWGRSVARAESPDFFAWDYRDPNTAPVVMTVDTRDAPGDEIYSMGGFPYEGMYIGLVQVFHNREDACHLDIQLAVSRDGVHFERVGDRAAFIPCGPVGSWDRFNTSVANNPPIEVGDELRFYFSGRTYRHSPYDGPDAGESGGAIGFATILRDRFVSLDASFDGGTVVTVPVRLTGATLRLNVESRFGEVLVEVLSSDGAVRAKSLPVAADGLDVAVEWEDGGVEGLEESVTLRFALKNARLYAVWSD